MKYIILFLMTTHLFATENIRLISVDGNIERAIRPDLVTFYLRVWAKSDRAQNALKAQVNESDKLKKVLIKFNINASELQTTAFEITPDYIWDQKTNKNIMNGHIVNELISVTLKKVEDAGQFLDEITSGDKNHGVVINGMNWDVSKRAEISKELLSEAVKIAREKAEILAKASSVKIKNVHNINSQNTFSDPVIMNMKAVNDVSYGANSAPSLQSGQVKISSMVNVQFEIE